MCNQAGMWPFWVIVANNVVNGSLFFSSKDNLMHSVHRSTIIDFLLTFLRYCWLRHGLENATNHTSRAFVYFHNSSFTWWMNIDHSIVWDFAFGTEMRVHLIVAPHHRSEVALLAILTINPDLLCAFLPASCALSSVPHEVSRALTVEHVLTFQSDRAAWLETGSADLVAVFTSLLHGPVYPFRRFLLISQSYSYLATKILSIFTVLFRHWQVRTCIQLYLHPTAWVCLRMYLNTQEPTTRRITPPMMLNTMSTTVLCTLLRSS